MILAEDKYVNKALATYKAYSAPNATAKLVSSVARRKSTETALHLEGQESKLERL